MIFQVFLTLLGCVLGAKYVACMCRQAGRHSCNVVVLVGMSRGCPPPWSASSSPSSSSGPSCVRLGLAVDWRLETSLKFRSWGVTSYHHCHPHHPHHHCHPCHPCRLATPPRPLARRRGWTAACPSSSGLTRSTPATSKQPAMDADKYHGRGPAGFTRIVAQYSDAQRRHPRHHPLASLHRRCTLSQAPAPRPFLRRSTASSRRPASTCFQRGSPCRRRAQSRPS